MKYSVFDGELIGLTHTIIIFEKKWWDIFLYLFCYFMGHFFILGRPVHLWTLTTHLILIHDIAIKVFCSFLKIKL